MCHAELLKNTNPLTKQSNISTEIDYKHKHRKHDKQTTCEILPGGNGRSLLYQQNNNCGMSMCGKSFFLFFSYQFHIPTQIDHTYILKPKIKTKILHTKNTLGRNARTRLADTTSLFGLSRF